MTPAGEPIPAPALSDATALAAGVLPAWHPARTPVGDCFDCHEPSLTVDESGRPCHPGCNLPGGVTTAPRQSRQPSAPVEEES